MTPDEIIKKVGKEKIKKALESNNGEDLKKLFEEEKIELTPEQMDYIAGGAGFFFGDNGLKAGNKGMVNQNGVENLLEEGEEDTCDGIERDKCTECT